MGRKCNSTLSSRIASFSLSLFVSPHSLRQFDLRQESHHEARADKWDIISQLPSICGPCVLPFFREHKLVSSPGLRLPSSRCRLLCRRPPTTTIRSDQIFFCCPPSSILHPSLPCPSLPPPPNTGCVTARARPRPPTPLALSQMAN